MDKWKGKLFEMEICTFKVDFFFFCVCVFVFVCVCVLEGKIIITWLRNLGNTCQNTGYFGTYQKDRACVRVCVCVCVCFVVCRSDKQIRLVTCKQSHGGSRQVARHELL